MTLIIFRIFLKDIGINFILIKGLGFGDDWMRELDWESRLKVSNWPWQVWLEYNAFPFRWVWMTQHEDLDRSTNNALYVCAFQLACFKSNRLFRLPKSALTVTGWSAVAYSLFCCFGGL